MNTTATLDNNDVRDNILATGQRLMAGKGFSAVGLNEILTGAGVPKGSFYHYFGSKDAFGEALLDSYFVDYLAELDATLAQPDMNMAQRLVNYFAVWQQTQSFSDCQGKCLAVKMAAEVADLSEAMRLAIKRGTEGIVSRLAAAIAAGVAEGSLQLEGGDAEGTAASLYQLWLGASVMVKIERRVDPFATAMTTTRKILHLSPA
jgi:TetR/AcrR family transcriptional repressor of nem operon